VSTLAKYRESLRAANTPNGWAQTGDSELKEDGLAQGQEDLQHLPHMPIPCMRARYPAQAVLAAEEGLRADRPAGRLFLGSAH
jgi:hypothetical protein